MENAVWILPPLVIAYGIIIIRIGVAGVDLADERLKRMRRPGENAAWRKAWQR